jgi:hypothetical protein
LSVWRHEPRRPRDLYPRLLRHAKLGLHAQDVLTFLGRKLHGGFAGDILTDWKRRWPGARVKHWMKTNWIKLYDKHGCVLRVETVINDPYEFKVRRRAGRRGHRTLRWTAAPITAWPRCVTRQRRARGTLATRPRRCRRFTSRET